MITSAQAQYIKFLFECMESGIDLNNKRLAEELGVSSPSASDMVKKLRNEGYVDKGSLKLTEEGRKEAALYVSKHRIWETFLIKALGYGWEEVHEDAIKLDSISSEKLYERLNEFLGAPKICPHGKPIYVNNPSMINSNEITLMNAETGREYYVAIVKDDKQLLNYLNDKHISLKSVIKVLRHDDYDQSVVIESDGNEIIIGEKPSKNIWLKLK